MEVLKEKLNKAFHIILQFVKNNLAEILVLVGLFFFIFAMFAYVSNLAGFIALGITLVLVGFMLSFIKYKSEL